MQGLGGSGERVRVVVADDHESLRRLLVLNFELTDDVDVVGEAADGPGAVTLALALRPDVLVVDLGLPGRAGDEVLREVRAQAPEVQVVVYTGRTGGDLGEQLLAAGAARYVVKSEVAEVVAAVRSLARAAAASRG